MSIVLTFIARVSDGMLLVASMDNLDSSYSNRSGLSLDVYKQQGKQIIKQLNEKSPVKCTIDGDSKYSFHYLMMESICYLTLTVKSYPKRLSFLYLEELHDGFVMYLKEQYGERGWRQQVGTIARPYAFIQFDKVIQRKCKEFSDPSSKQNMSKLNDNLADIQNIMKKNIQEVLNRGERIENVSNMSANLADRSKQFKWGAKKLSLQALYRKYGPIVAICLFMLLVIYIKFF